VFFCRRKLFFVPVGAGFVSSVLEELVSSVFAACEGFLWFVFLPLAVWYRQALYLNSGRQVISTGAHS